ncbi:alpha/beta fold hydrolase [Nonomuraea sp. NPDC003754]
MIRRGYAQTPFGQLHYAECGAGEPVVLLHQSPRSWDEYYEVLPILGRTHRAIAMDTIGFGASARLAEHSIEAYGEALVAFLDALDLARVSLVGHHTGGVIAVEVAATAPERVERLVLSSTPYVDEEARAKRRERPPVDHVVEKPDGGHLTDLWQRRQGFYPSGRSDILTRFVRDALGQGEDVEKGHQAVARYRMEERVGKIACPVLCVGATDDPFAYPELENLPGVIPGALISVIKGGMVPLPEQRPEEFARVVLDFLSADRG